MPPKRACGDAEKTIQSTDAGAQHVTHSVDLADDEDERCDDGGDQFVWAPKA